MIFPSQIHSPSSEQPHLADSDSVTAAIPQDHHSFQALFTAALDAMLILDDQGCYIDANPAACQLLGLDRQDLLGCCPSDFAAPGFNFAPAWQQFLEQGQGRGEFSLIQSDGELREIEYAATANFIPHYHLLNLRDVTAYKRTAARLNTLENLLNRTVAEPPISHPDSLEAMQKSDEERYRLQKIAKNVPGVIYQFTLHPDGRISLPYASEGLRDIFGVPPEAVREDAAHVFETIHPDDLPRLNQSILESAQQLTPWHCEYRICHPDGRLLWAVGHSTPQRQPDGGTTWYGYIRDITPQKEVEQALRQSESKFRNLIDNLNDMVFIVDVDGTFSYVSSTFEVVMGYAVEELLNHPFSEVVHPEELPICWEIFHRALAGEKSRDAAYRCLHKDGQYYWHSTNVSPLTDDNGQVIGCLGIARYIHDEKQAAIALRESHIRLQLALEAANIGAWDWNPQTNEVVSSRQWKAMLGYKEDEIGNSLAEWESRVHPEDIQGIYRDIAQHIAGQTSVYQNEHRMQCKDGSYKWMLGRGQVIERDEEGNPVRFIGIHYDIAERKASEMALQELTQQLQKAQEVAHLGHWSIDVVDEKMSWSEEVFRIFGMTPDQQDLTFTEHLQQIHPDDRAFLQERFAQALQGVTQNFDIRIVRPDGEVRHINTRAEIQLREGEVVRIFGTAMDITERKTAELELEQFFRISPDLLSIADTAGYFRRLNRSWETNLGYSIEELEGEPFLRLVHPDDFASTLAALSDLANGNKGLKFVNRYRAKDGSYRYIEWLANPHGTLIYAAARDITERIQAEATIRASEDKLRSLFNLSPLGIARNDMQGKFIEINTAFETITGYSKEELNQLSYWDLTPSEYADDEARQLELLQTTGRYGPYQKEYIHKQGHRVPVELTGALVTGADGQQYIWSIIGDITDRQQAEKALRDSEAQTRALLEAIPDMMLRYNRENIIVDCKLSQEVALLMPPEQFLGKNLHQVLPEFLAAKTSAAIAATLANQNQINHQMQEFEYELLMPEGMRTYESRFTQCGADDVFCMIRDVTERKQAEAQLQEISERLSLSLKSAAIGCWEWSIIENTLIWDDRMYEIYGVTKESDTRLAYDIWATALHPHDREASETLIRQAVLGQAEFNPEFRVVHPDGSIHFIQAFGIVMRNAEGNPQKMIGVNFEITERKQAEAQLQSLLNRTQLLNQISTEIRHSLELDILLQSAVNAIFAELQVDVCTFGWYRPELDPPMWEVVKERRHRDVPSWLGLFPLDGFQPLLATILRQQIYRLDMNTTVPDEGVKAFCQQMGITMYLGIPIHTIGGQIGAFDLGRIAGDRPWQDDEIQLLQSIGTQVAIAIQQAQLYQESQAKSQELQQAYQELQQTQIQLIQAEKMSSLGQLVAGVAHEINNPVSFIYGNLTHISEYSDNLIKLIQLYQDCYPNPPEAISDYIEEIGLDFLTEDFPKIITSMQNGASRIRNIVKSLRTFSRLDEADFKAVDLHENLDSTLVILQNRFNGRAGNPHIHLVKQYGDLPPIECYSGLLNQVFMNLLVNAIEAIEDRQTREAADYTGVITITTAIEDNWVSISIQDNGIGMSPEVQAKIFNPFFTTKPIGKGTGMGLSISYQIVTQNHQGELSWSSAPGVGTEFKIKLPLR